MSSNLTSSAISRSLLWLAKLFLGARMPELEDVFRKFGEVAEAAQLLETELGTLLIANHCEAEGLFDKSDPERARVIIENVDRKTLGQLLLSIQKTEIPIEELELSLAAAKSARNHLFHSFYRFHSFAKFNEEGRASMLVDLERLHEKILKAFKEVMLLSGIDLDLLVDQMNAKKNSQNIH